MFSSFYSLVLPQYCSQPHQTCEAPLSFISAMMILAAAAGTVSFNDMCDPKVRVLCFLVLNTKILVSQVTAMFEHQSPLVTCVGVGTLLTMPTVIYT